MATVTITGVTPDPETFVSVADALTYVKGMFGGTYATWLLLTPNEQAQTLLAATRYMDRLGLVDESDVAIDHSTTIQPVIDACCELAVLIGDDPDIVAALDGSSNIRSVDAGGAGVQFFNPTTVASGTATRLPVVIQQLLGPYLPAPASSSGGSAGASGCATPDFDCDSTFRRNRP